MRLLEHRWRRAPTQAVGIDWSNPITRGLVFAYVGGVGVEFVNKRVIERVDGPGSAMSRAGRGDVFTTNTQTARSTLPRTVLAGPCTLLSIADWQSGYALLIGQLGLDGTWYGSNLVIESNSALNLMRSRGDNVIAFREVELTGVPVGLGTFASTHDGNAANAAKMFINGSQSASTTVNTEAFTAHSVPMRIGGYVATATPNHKTFLALAFERELALREIRELTLGIGNPWQVFRPIRRMYVNAPVQIPTLSAATVANLTATTATPRVTVTF